MNLLDQVEHTINLGDRKIRGLIVEPDTASLFWINEVGSSQFERQIERYDIKSGEFEVLRDTSADVQGELQVLVTGLCASDRPDMLHQSSK